VFTGIFAWGKNYPQTVRPCDDINSIAVFALLGAVQSPPFSHLVWFDKPPYNTSII